MVISMQESKGFTLIELLVVIAIIGMLSSVVLSSLNSARTKSRDARRLADIKQIQTALEMYYDDRSTPEYPNDSPAGSVPSTLVSNGYLSSLPTDPVTGNAYYYRNLSASLGNCSVGSGVCASYVLGAQMETDHAALASDVDGNVPSSGSHINCTDTVYCVMP